MKIQYNSILQLDMTTKTTNHAIFKATTETPPQTEQKAHTPKKKKKKIANKLPICHPSNCSILNEIENLIIKRIFPDDLVIDLFLHRRQAASSISL